MNKQELIKKVADTEDMSVEWAGAVVRLIDAEGWLRHPGEPIDPEDIREGDRYRAVYATGTIQEKVASGPQIGIAEEYFLLDRPKPELPTKPGSVIRVHRDGVGPVYTLGADGVWRYGSATFPADYFTTRDWEVVA